MRVGQSRIQLPSESNMVIDKKGEVSQCSLLATSRTRGFLRARHTARNTPPCT
jgi:hypothetical protein